MKIAYVCNEYPPRPHGGIGTFVQALSHGMCTRGHEVTVVGLGEAYQEYKDQGVRVTTLRANKTRYLGPLIARIGLHRWLSSRVRSGKLDIIEAPEFGGFLPFNVSGCQVILRLHDSVTCMARQTRENVRRSVSFYERRTLRTNLYWIAVSRFILDLTQTTFGIAPKLSAIIYNPVGPLPNSFPEVPGLPASYVLYAGSVSRRKGALVLAEAARDFMPTHPELHLVYAGTLVEENGRSIAENIREILGPDLAQRVHCLGHLDRAAVLTCMTHAKVFALPSFVEAFSLSPPEAMACGAPVVYTKVASGPEAVEDGITGLLADPHAPGDVGRKVACLLDDPDFATRLATNGRKTVAQRYSLEKCVEATEEFYRECLDHRNTGTTT
ncbi:MAG: glycosyltransferase family 4 protein [Terriglobia bacterium]|jgi:glycosyltransferase involved in cell wall biosynthesis